MAYLGETPELLKSDPFERLKRPSRYTTAINATRRVIADAFQEGCYAPFMHCASVTPAFNERVY